MSRTSLVTLALVGASLLGAPIARADYRGLSLETVNAVVEQNERAVQACAREARGKAHGDTVAVMMSLTIDEDGRVAAATADARSRAGLCLEKVARKLQFPPPGTTTRIAFPFLLVPRR